MRDYVIETRGLTKKYGEKNCLFTGSCTVYFNCA